MKQDRTLELALCWKKGTGDFFAKPNFKITLKNKKKTKYLYISFILLLRYYGLIEKLETLHADPSKAGSKPYHYDGDHERRRKEQLVRLYNRTPEEVEEEEMLRAEMKKIEARKKER